MQATLAHLNEESPRHADWLKVFGSSNVPVLSPIPVRANLPGKPDTLVLQLDLKALDAAQRARLVAHLAERFNIPAAEVEGEIDAAGVPILDEDVCVGFDMRLML